MRVDLSAANTIVRGNDIFSNPGLAIQSDGTNNLIEQNTIHGNATSQFGPSA
jgi:parallel beta-helix repeat protein